MEQETDRAYVEFWRQFNDPASPADDAAGRVDLLDRMSEDRRAQAAVRLVARLKRSPRDRRIIHALGHLRVESAAPLLEDLASERSPAGVESLLALWRIDRREERVAALVDALRHTVSGRLRRWLVGADDVRVAAAIALGHIDMPASRAALAEAARDLDAVVKSSARASLRRLGESAIQAAAEAEDKC